MKLVKIFLILFFTVQSFQSYAFCPNTPRVRTVFTRADATFIGKVLSRRDADIMGRDSNLVCYRVEVKKLFRGPKKKFIEVWEENASARMGLDINHTYLFFLRKFLWGNYKGKLVGYCDDAIDILDKEYNQKFLDLEKVMNDMKAGVGDGDIQGYVWDRVENKYGGYGVEGVRFVVKGNGISKTVISDKNGYFHLNVKPGHYEVKPLEHNKWIMSFYTLDDPNDVDVRAAGGGEVTFEPASQ